MILGFLINVIGTSLMANPGGEVNKLVQSAFKKQFPNAKHTSWETVVPQDLYMVRFVNNDQALVAYISDEGELLATARTAMPASLPLPVSNLLSTEYGSYELVDAVELVMHGELAYLVNVENRKRKMTLMVYSNGSAREIKKEKIKSNQ